MTVAHDTSSYKYNSNVTSSSHSHTCTGSDLILIVGVSAYDLFSSDRVVSSITYNGTSLTKLASQDYSSGYINSELWYLIGPATGTHTLAVTMSGECSEVTVGAMSFTGVDQTSPIDASNSASTNNNQNPSISVTTSADGCWVADCIAGTQDLSGITVGTGQTQAWNTNGTTSAGGSYKGPQTSAGSVSMTWDGGWGSFDSASCVTAFKPVQTAYYDASSQGSGSGTSHTITHTASGTNRLAVISIGVHDSNDISRPVTSVTYDGVACTKVASEDTGAGTSERSELWYIVDPNTTTNANVVVSTTGSVSNISIGCMTFKSSTGAFSLDTSNTANGNSSSPTVSVTTGASDTIVADSMASEANISTANAGQTMLVEQEPVSYRTLGGSWSGQFASGSSVSHGYSLAYGSRWRMVSASFKVAASSSSNISQVVGTLWSSISQIAGINKSNINKLAGVTI